MVTIIALLIVFGPALFWIGFAVWVWTR